MAARDSHRKYYCLLMITDGVLLDMPVRRDPFSIPMMHAVPCGCLSLACETRDHCRFESSVIDHARRRGKEDFSKMVELDSDDVLLSEDGVYAERDIVQFVEFEKYKNNGEALAKELLAEFPGQFLTYMKSDISLFVTRLTGLVTFCRSRATGKQKKRR